MGKAAPLTQRLGDTAFRECLPHPDGTLAGQNVGKRRFKQIAEGNDAVRIQAARNHRSVAENTDLIDQSKAGMRIPAVVRFRVRPLKFFAPFQKKFVADLISDRKSVV